jgi:hypothetical protein
MTESDQNKKKFNWSEGGLLDETNYEEIGGVGEVGREYIEQSVPADAKLRVKLREEKFKKEKGIAFNKTSTKATPQKTNSSKVITSSDKKLDPNFDPKKSGQITEQTEKSQIKNIFNYKVPEVKKIKK